MNSNTRRFAFLVTAIVLFALVATGCNTTRGLGRDVEKLGDKIQEKASR